MKKIGKICGTCGQKIKRTLNEAEEALADEFRQAFLTGSNDEDFESNRYTVQDVLKVLSWPNSEQLDRRMVGDVIRKKWDITTRKTGGIRLYFLPSVNPGYKPKPVKMSNLKKSLTFTK
ncbi:MAG TPA: hypothetical protein PLN79_12090 [bacterium]|nr:hypothetical protein [bacterium]